MQQVAQAARAVPPGSGLVAGAAALVLAVGLLSVPSVAGHRAAAPVSSVAVGRAAARPLPVTGEVVAPLEAPADVVGAPPQPVPVAPADLAAATAEAVRAGTPPAAPAPVPAALEERALGALSALDFPWQELGYDLRFRLYRGGKLLGLTDARTRTITLFVRPSQSDTSLRVTLAHEIGHALDAETGTDQQRARYLELRGLPADTPWYPCDGCSDVASGAGDWAEVFAVWLAGAGDFRSELAGPPDDATLARISALFAPPSQRARPAAATPAPQDSPAPRPSRSPRPLLPLG